MGLLKQVMKAARVEKPQRGVSCVLPRHFMVPKDMRPKGKEYMPDIDHIYTNKQAY